MNKRRTGWSELGSAASAALLGTAACALSSAAAVAEPRAGTAIPNRAAVRFTADGATRQADSNIDTLRVAERLDIALAPAGPVVATSDGQLVRATLTHRGNGDEAFDIAVTTPGVTVLRAFLDADGDGLPSTADVEVAGRTPVLAPGAVRTVLMLVRAADAVSETEMRARAATGSGAPGTGFAGQGDGGSDAVTGPTGAEARLAFPLVADAAAPTIAKRQAVAIAGGGTQPGPGDIVTYSIEARFGAAVSDAGIDDLVPANTRFVAGSLRLDGATLTEAADADVGEVSGDRLRVGLGAVPAGAVRQVEFKVIIQ